MRTLSSRFLLTTGLCALTAGLVWDVLFAGIPYQDPTPEMTARHEFHAAIASTLRWIGFASCLAAALRRMVTSTRTVADSP